MNVYLEDGRVYVRLETECHATALDVITAFYNAIDFDPVTPVDDYGDEIELGVPVCLGNSYAVYYLSAYYDGKTHDFILDDETMDELNRVGGIMLPMFVEEV